MNAVFPRVKKIATLLNIDMAQAGITKAILTEEVDSTIFKGTSNEVRSRGQRINNQMEAINTVIKGFGVECIRQLNLPTDNYWMDTRAIYINMGDTYAQTLIYDVNKDRFYFMSWGDFVEKAQTRGAQFP